MATINPILDSVFTDATNIGLHDAVREHLAEIANRFNNDPVADFGQDIVDEATLVLERLLTLTTSGQCDDADESNTRPAFVSELPQLIESHAVHLLGDSGGRSLIKGEVYESGVHSGMSAIETEHGTIYLETNRTIEIDLS